MQHPPDPGATLRATALAAIAAAAAALTFACTTSTSSPDTTTAPVDSSDAHDAEELVSVVSAAPAPAGAACLTSQDLTSEGDVTRTARAIYRDDAAKIMGQLTLQETEEGYADVMLSNAFKRNSLEADFPGVEGAKTRATPASSGDPTDGTPVAFARGDTVVLLSVTGGREADLADWAPALESYVESGTAGGEGAALPECP